MHMLASGPKKATAAGVEKFLMLRLRAPGRMNMSTKLASFFAGAMLLVSISSPAIASIITNPFVAATGGAPIGFAYAGNKFVGSNYFNNQLYQTDLNGGSVAAFGAPLPIASGAIGEVYVSSSLGLGGFGSRDIFAGSEALGTVYKFNNDGTGQTVLASGLIGGVRSIAFDPYGLYGNNMIVATNAGRIYSINSLGAVTQLAITGEDTEGLSFAPQAFGPVPAHTLVVASEGSGSLRAVAPNGALSIITTIASAEMVSFVPLNLGISGNPLEGFYAANYATNVIKSPYSEFTSYLGDMIVTGETTHAIWDVRWDGSSFVQTQIGTFPNQPEDGIFVTAAILNPGCEETNTCAGSAPEPGALALVGLGLALLGLHPRWSQAIKVGAPSRSD